MNFNFQKARDYMIENQLRPNKINNPEILKLFKNIKKEDFILNDDKLTSYNDLDIKMDSNRGYLKNLHIAQLIKFSEINKHHKVLHIGGLTGYVSVMLSLICKNLIVIENNKKLIDQFEKNINNLKITNIKIVSADYMNGFDKDLPYDVIFIDNPIYDLNDILKDQLTSNSGKIIMVKKIEDQLCKAYKITKNTNNYTIKYLFDIFTNYQLYKINTKFVF